MQRLEQQYRTRLEEQLAKQTRMLCAQLEELQEAQQKAGEVDELKREFLSLISHELRTPLNGIMGSIQLMEESDMSAAQSGHLGLLKTSTQKMLNLVNNLLTLVEARSDNQIINAIKGTPCLALDALEKRYRDRADSSGITFITDCADLPSHTLDGPWSAIQIIGGCLLDNAFKFTGRGGKVTCLIWAERESAPPHEATVLLQVSDNGTGIPVSRQEVIFQPFTQVEHYLTRRNDGSGIGLAIVRTICDKLKGALTLESSPERGSSFTCSLPFKTAPVTKP
jgi:signal transduction histidine kinase